MNQVSLALVAVAFIRLLLLLPLSTISLFITRTYTKSQKQNILANKSRKLLRMLKQFNGLQCSPLPILPPTVPRPQLP